MDKAKRERWRKKIVEFGEKTAKEDPALGEWIKNNTEKIMAWYLANRREMTPKELRELVEAKQ